VTNDGTIRVTEVVTTTPYTLLGLPGSGTVSFEANVTLGGTSALDLKQNVTVSGTTTLTATAITVFTGTKTVTVEAGSTLALGMGFTGFDTATVKNNGTISTAATDVANLQTIINQGGGTISASGTITVAGGSAITVPANTTLKVTGTGTVGGAGTIRTTGGTVEVANAANLQWAFTKGTEGLTRLKLTGDVSLTANASISAGVALTIAAGKALTVPANYELAIDHTATGSGTIIAAADGGSIKINGLPENGPNRFKTVTAGVNAKDIPAAVTALLTDIVKLQDREIHFEDAEGSFHGIGGAMIEKVNTPSPVLSIVNGAPGGPITLSPGSALYSDTPLTSNEANPPGSGGQAVADDATKFTLTIVEGVLSITDTGYTGATQTSYSVTFPISEGMGIKNSGLALIAGADDTSSFHIGVQTMR
jgi:hypothetical protein